MGLGLDGNGPERNVREAEKRENRQATCAEKINIFERACLQPQITATYVNATADSDIYLEINMKILRLESPNTNSAPAWKRASSFEFLIVRAKFNNNLISTAMRTNNFLKFLWFFC